MMVGSVVFLRQNLSPCIQSSRTVLLERGVVLGKFPLGWIMQRAGVFFSVLDTKEVKLFFF